MKVGETANDGGITAMLSEPKIIKRIINRRQELTIQNWNKKISENLK